jgi:3-deoxy-7-phosphoheptulonate synthase
MVGGPAGVPIGPDTFALIAGPCAVESLQQTLEAAEMAKAAGATVLRGGAFKPRTSPQSFQGLGEQGLRILAEAREATGLPVVTEVLDAHDVPLVASYADMLQIGTRNMHNYALLQAVGKSERPVLLKRGMQATVDEWLTSAEYIAQRGNLDIVLCERGIRTFETSTRNTLDISAVPVVQGLSHLPVVIDPSHSGGPGQRQDQLPGRYRRRRGRHPRRRPPVPRGRAGGRPAGAVRSRPARAGLERAPAPAVARTQTSRAPRPMIIVAKRPHTGP